MSSAGRKLPHYYYRFDPHTHVKSAHFAGVDIQSDGCYVLAPPTQIDDGEYQLIRGGMPHRITQSDVNKVIEFFESCSQRPQIVHGESPETKQLKTLSTLDVVQLYHRLADTTGRNNALFQVAMTCRDEGWSKDQVISNLAILHTQKQKRGAAKQEIVSRSST